MKLKQLYGNWPKMFRFLLKWDEIVSLIHLINGLERILTELFKNMCKLQT